VAAVAVAVAVAAVGSRCPDCRHCRCCRCRDCRCRGSTDRRVGRSPVEAVAAEAEAEAAPVDWRYPGCHRSHCCRCKGYQRRANRGRREGSYRVRFRGLPRGRSPRSRFAPSRRLALDSRRRSMRPAQMERQLTRSGVRSRSRRRRTRPG